MAIKAIIFDCFGVLVMSGRQTVLHDFPGVKDQLHDLSVRSDYGFISREEYDQELSELTGISVEEFETRYWAKNVRNEPAIQWVKSLKDSGEYKIGLLSNIGRNWLDDFLPEQERKELFDDEVLSGVVGMTKPDEKIFELAAERLGVEASECVMIDDILQNIQAASNTGMQGIVYDTTEESIKELRRILGVHSA